MKIPIEESAFSRNDRTADELRAKFARHGVAVVNLMSSPGSGKTSLLERTTGALGGELRMAAIEGDPQTDRDAQRLNAAGLRAVQIVTVGGCHLDSEQVADALGEFDLDQLDLLFIENVGNLLCPAAFDLGETADVIVFSTTEGHDKPGKYPEMFVLADLVVVNKMDLAEAADFDEAAFEADVRRINGDVPIVKVSCKTGDGVDGWADWLRELVRTTKDGA